MAGPGPDLGPHGERVECEPIKGIWGQSRQRGPGAEPVVRESWCSISDAERLFALSQPEESVNLS